MMDDSDVDPVLEMFVRTMNKLDGQISLTVLVGGSWLSGTLIAPRMFTEEAGANVVKVAGEKGNPVNWFFREVGKLCYPSESEVEAGQSSLESPADSRVHYLHLRNGRSVSAGGSVPTPGTYVRVRLSAVDAWVVGEFTPPGHEPPPPPPPPE